jgi:2-oxoglutarate ferredoxin oxidoreductase subunit beta
MEKVYGVPEGINDIKTGFCPGCSHPTAEKIIAEVLGELGYLGKTILCMPIGCALHANPYFEIDQIQCLHGRASAVAAGAARMNPDKCIITYQGDGDAMSIGMSETFYSANRGEKFTCIVINNQIYGMTGGQMAPTSLVGQNSTTGVRLIERTGYPVRFAEIVASLEAPGYVARGALHSPKHIIQAKKYIEKAIRCQMEHGKYSYVELLSICPTNWGILPKNCPQYAEEHVIPIFPLGEKKNTVGV